MDIHTQQQKSRFKHYLVTLLYHAAEALPMHECFLSASQMSPTVLFMGFMTNCPR